MLCGTAAGAGPAQEATPTTTGKHKHTHTQEASFGRNYFEPQDPFLQRRASRAESYVHQLLGTCQGVVLHAVANALAAVAVWRVSVLACAAGKCRPLMKPQGCTLGLSLPVVYSSRHVRKMATYPLHSPAGQNSTPQSTQENCQKRGGVWIPKDNAS